jgi:hypothetical protein
MSSFRQAMRVYGVVGFLALATHPVSASQLRPEELRDAAAPGIAVVECVWAALPEATKIVMTTSPGVAVVPDVAVQPYIEEALRTLGFSAFEAMTTECLGKSSDANAFSADITPYVIASLPPRATAERIRGVLTENNANADSVALTIDRMNTFRRVEVGDLLARGNGNLKVEIGPDTFRSIESALRLSNSRYGVPASEGRRLRSVSQLVSVGLLEQANIEGNARCMTLALHGSCLVRPWVEAMRTAPSAIAEVAEPIVEEPTSR